MPIGIGAHKAASDFGAVHRGCGDTKGIQQGCDIKPAIVKQLKHMRVFQDTTQVRGFGLPQCYLNQMGITVAPRKLHHAQSVTMRVQTHGFAVDGHEGAKIQPVRQVMLIKFICHVPPISPRAAVGKCRFFKLPIRPKSATGRDGDTASVNRQPEYGLLAPAIRRASRDVEAGDASEPACANCARSDNATWQFRAG